MNTYSIEKYSFSRSTSPHIPPSDLDWTHFPHRDNLDLLADTTTSTLKILWNVQNLEELNVSELVKTHDGLVIMGRPPCLAVKYVKPGESLLRRWQVRFRFQRDYADVTGLLERWGCVVKLRELPQQMEIFGRAGPQVQVPLRPIPGTNSQQYIRNETPQHQQQQQIPQNESGATTTAHGSQVVLHRLFPAASSQQLPPPQQQHGLQYSVATANGLLNSYVPSPPTSSPQETRLPFPAQFQPQPQQPQPQPHQQHAAFQHLLPSHPYQYPTTTLYPTPNNPAFQHLPLSSCPPPTFQAHNDGDDELPPPRKPITYDKNETKDLLASLQLKPLNKPTPSLPPGLITPKKTPAKRPTVRKPKAAAAKQSAMSLLDEEGDGMAEEMPEKTPAKRLAARKEATALKAAVNKRSALPEKRERAVSPIDDEEEPAVIKKQTIAKPAEKRKRAAYEETEETEKNGEKAGTFKKPDPPKKPSQKSPDPAAEERRLAQQKKRKETLEKKKAALELLKKEAAAAAVPPVLKETPEEKKERQQKVIREMILAALEDEEFLQMCEVVAGVWQRVGLATVGKDLFSEGGYKD